MNKYFLIGGGASILGLAYFAKRKSSGTEQALRNAIAGVKPAVPDDNNDSLFSLGPTEDTPVVPVVPAGSGPTIKLRLTGYWPFTARDDEKKMEGGVVGRHEVPLHTLEDVQAGKAPYVSLSGDYTIWPFGQRIAMDEFPGIVFRVVDTGSHFVGPSKIFRVVGAEPIDVCVNSSATILPKLVNAHIVAGDDFSKQYKKDPQSIAYDKFKDQNVIASNIVAPIKTGGNI